MTELERTHERFRTTRWTQIRALCEGGEEERREALEALVYRYWPPVYAYLRTRRRMERERAAELTQEFFANVVLGRGLFERARERRGRLRTLLLTALQRYEIDRHRYAVARGRDVTVSIDRLDREDARLAHASGSAPDGEPDHAFERRWALGLLEESLRRCEAHFRESGRDGHWTLFEDRVLRPAISRAEPEPLATAAAKHGFRSPALGAAAVQVVRRRAAILLREVVAETVEDDADTEAELAQVRRHLETPA